LRDAGFAVDVICDYEPGKPRNEYLEGVTVLRLLFQHKRHSILRYLVEYATLPFLAGIIVATRFLRHGYDYVEIDNPPDWLVLAGLFPRLLGATIVLYMFENMPEIMAVDHGLSPGHPLMRALCAVERFCAGLAHHLIAPHEMARRLLIEQGVPPEKVAAVVPNVPDERVFFSLLHNEPITAGGRCVAESQGSTDHCFRLVTHGTMLQRYGIETLLEAVALIHHLIPGLHLDVIGDGEYRPMLEKLATHLRLDATVTFIDRVPFDRLAARLVGAEIGIVPMWVPFVPNKLMEYMALNLPVIAADWPSLRLCFDDSAIFYVEPRNAAELAQAIITLYQDPQRRAALAAAARTVYRARFAWDHTKNDYLAVYGKGTRAKKLRRSGDSAIRVMGRMRVP
jgi:glycosyltransferase involved in cell wall biosynthesis